MKREVKIIQIVAVCEGEDERYGTADGGEWKRVMATEATIYGLGEDGKPYRWSKIKEKWLTV